MVIMSSDNRMMSRMQSVVQQFPEPCSGVIHTVILVCDSFCYLFAVPLRHHKATDCLTVTIAKVVTVIMAVTKQAAVLFMVMPGVRRLFAASILQF